MVALVMVVRDILTDRASQVALAERDHSMQTLDRSANGCLHDVDTGGAQDTPITRPVSAPSDTRIVATPEVGGRHHRYDRIAA
jgi:hypothetical protein